jgi:hypothetical protein
MNIAAADIATAAVREYRQIRVHASTAWDRLAVQYQQASPPPAEVERLHQENEGLRQQLVAQIPTADSAASSSTSVTARRPGTFEQHLAAIVENSDDAIVSNDLEAASCPGTTRRPGCTATRLRRRSGSRSTS